MPAAVVASVKVQPLVRDRIEVFPRSGGVFAEGTGRPDGAARRSEALSDSSPIVLNRLPKAAESRRLVADAASPVMR
jgi:hypothetical protein